jgi:ketosteroid isomerase-like protein
MRRDVLAGATALAATTPMALASSVQTDLTVLSTRAYAALMKGDAVTYAAIMKHTDDYTLMQPFGGKVVRGFDPSPEHLSRLGSFFKNGDFRQDLIQFIASGDVAVLVTTEHQSVEVGGLPMQEWPLRVTLVFRRENGEWHIAHRHADPLARGVTVQHAAALARGDFAESRS